MNEVALLIAEALRFYFKNEPQFYIRSKDDNLLINTEQILRAFADCHGKCTMDYLIEKGKEV